MEGLSFSAQFWFSFIDLVVPVFVYCFLLFFFLLLEVKPLRRTAAIFLAIRLAQHGAYSLSLGPLLIDEQRFL